MYTIKKCVSFEVKIIKFHYFRIERRGNPNLLYNILEMQGANNQTFLNSRYRLTGKLSAINMILM